MSSSSPWSRRTDPSSGTDFYFNYESSESLWVHPTPKGWAQHSDASGTTIYVHPATGQSTLEAPPLPLWEAALPCGWERFFSEEHGKAYSR